MSGKHSKKVRINWARMSVFIAFVLVLAVALFSVVSCALKSRDSNEKGSGTTVNQQGCGQENSGSQTGENQQSSGQQGGNDAPAADPQPEKTAAQLQVEEAKTMQDYTIQSSTGKAVPLDTVDDNYLVLANKTHPMTEKYAPDDMVTVSRFVEGVGNADTHKLRKVAADALEAMFDAAEADGITLKMRTGYRSYSYQASLFSSYVKNNGEAKANTFSARAGESEHQTGLACDLGGKSQNYALSYDFGTTAEGKWVAEHAHEYGFIIRFTDGQTVNGERQPGKYTGYVYEPWHIRYLGVDVATEVKEMGVTYEEYLGVID